MIRSNASQTQNYTHKRRWIIIPLRYASRILRSERVRIAKRPRFTMRRQLQFRWHWNYREVVARVYSHRRWIKSFCRVIRRQLKSAWFMGDDSRCGANHKKIAQPPQKRKKKEGKNRQSRIRECFSNNLQLMKCTCGK